jgi:hypothetical protein
MLHTARRFPWRRAVHRPGDLLGDGTGRACPAWCADDTAWKLSSAEQTSQKSPPARPQGSTLHSWQASAGDGAVVKQ